MNDISGFGATVVLRATNTFPNGFSVSQFADDADPVDVPSIQLADKAMGLNGDLITWAKGQPLPVTIAVIPDSDDDRNLQVLAEANRTAKGKAPARDIITLTIVYPDGKTTVFSQGKITDAMPTNSIASAGRMKSKTYAFAFENLTRSN